MINNQKNVEEDVEEVQRRSEGAAIGRRQEAELEVAELKMLRFSLGVKRMDRFRNEVIRGTTHTGRPGEKARNGLIEMVWTCAEEDSGYIVRRVLEMKLSGRRQRGRPKRRFMDVVRENMQVVGVRVENTDNSLQWKTVICCGDPLKGTSRIEKEKKV